MVILKLVIVPSFLTNDTVSPDFTTPLVIRPIPNLPIYSSYPKLEICNCKLSFSLPSKGLHCFIIVSSIIYLMYGPADTSKKPLINKKKRHV